MVMPSSITVPSFDQLPSRLPSRLVAVRIVNKSHGLEYLVRWAGMSSLHDSWKKVDDINDQTLIDKFYEGIEAKLHDDLAE